jgi:hypothetical protein
MSKILWLVATASAAVVLVAQTQRAAAQSPATDAVPVGVRGGAHLIDDVTSQLKSGAPSTLQPTNWIVVSSSFVGTAASSIYGNALGYLYRGRRDIFAFQVLAAPKLVDQASVSHLRAGGEAKLTWSPPVNQSKASLRVAYQNTADVGARQDYVLAAEQAFALGDSGKVALGASADYVVSNPRIGPSIRATKVSIGSTFTLSPRTEVEVDYSFKNTVDHTDDASLTLSQSLIASGVVPTILVTAGKGRLIALSLLLKLRA